MSLLVDGPAVDNSPLTILAAFDYICRTHYDYSCLHHHQHLLADVVVVEAVIDTAPSSSAAQLASVAFDNIPDAFVPALHLQSRAVAVDYYYFEAVVVIGDCCHGCFDVDHSCCCY